jgi:hypothetical protein
MPGSKFNICCSYTRLLSIDAESPYGKSINGGSPLNKRELLRDPEVGGPLVEPVGDVGMQHDPVPATEVHDVAILEDRLLVADRLDHPLAHAVPFEPVADHRTRARQTAGAPVVDVDQQPAMRLVVERPQDRRLETPVAGSNPAIRRVCGGRSPIDRSWFRQRRRCSTVTYSAPSGG